MYQKLQKWKLAEDVYGIHKVYIMRRVISLEIIFWTFKLHTVRHIYNIVHVYTSLNYTRCQTNDLKRKSITLNKTLLSRDPFLQLYDVIKVQ